MSGFAEKVISRYQNQGFHLVEKIYSWRFFTAILEKEGQKYFLKIGQKSSKFFVDRPLDKMWAREEKFVNFVNSRLDQSTEVTPFRLVKFIERGQDEEVAWTLQEYISGEHIFDPESDGTVEPLRWLPTIVRIIQWFDNQSTDEWGPLDRDLRREFLEKMDKWSKEPFEKGALSQTELGRAKQLVNRYASLTEIRLQHGDLVPWHMHNGGFPKVVLIDLEAANLRYRYYDLAYIYHRIFTKRAEPVLAKALLTEFLKSVDDQEEFMRKLVPSLANRAIGGLQDYCNEFESRSKESNKQHLELQRRFLELVLKEDLKVLV